VTAGRTVVMSEEHSAGISLEHSGNNISIRMWQNREDYNRHETKSEVIQLSKLPARRNLANSSLAVGRAGADSVNIVLNKTVRNWDDMTTAVDTQLPMIISRDVDSLALRPGQGRLLDRVS
jgi:hypothetical protein